MRVGVDKDCAPCYKQHQVSDLVGHDAGAYALASVCFRGVVIEEVRLGFRRAHRARAGSSGAGRS